MNYLVRDDVNNWMIVKLNITTQKINERNITSFMLRRFGAGDNLLFQPNGDKQPNILNPLR
jgi:hypothetical protein